MKPAHYTTLENHDERTVAHLAARARSNTIFGGVSALMIAKRAVRMGSKNALVSVVSDVYSSSTGKHHHDHEAWECKECGQSYLGQDAAGKCCAEQAVWQTGWDATEEGGLDT